MSEYKDYIVSVGQPFNAFLIKVSVDPGSVDRINAALLICTLASVSQGYVFPGQAINVGNQFGELEKLRDVLNEVLPVPQEKGKSILVDILEDIEGRLESMGRLMDNGTMPSRVLLGLTTDVKVWLSTVQGGGGT